MIVREAKLIGWIVVPIGEVYELDGLNSERFIAVSDTWRNQDFPGLKAADENRIDESKGWGTAAKIVQKNLNHSGYGSPKIGLFAMIVDGFNGARIGEGQGNLNFAKVIGKHLGGETFSEAGKLGKKTTIIGKYLEGFNLHTMNQVGRIRPGDYLAEGPGGPAHDGQVDSVTNSKGDNFGLRFMHRRNVSRHSIAALHN